MTRWVRSEGWGVVDRSEGAEHGGSLYVADLANGRIHILAGPAAVIGRAALRGHDMRGICAEAASTFEVAVDDVEVDVVEEVLDDMVRIGLLTAR